MESEKEIMEEIILINDPRRAYLTICEVAERLNCTRNVIERMIDTYMRKHKLDVREMMFYPDGRKVLTLEVLWEIQQKVLKENIVAGNNV